MLRFARMASAMILLLGWVSTRVPAQSDDRLELLSALVKDDSAKVRLEALRALAKIPTGRSAELALGVLEKPMDPTLDYALWLTINDLAQPWIAAVKSGDWKPEGREVQLAFALKALKSDQVAQVLSSVLGEKPLARDGAGPWIEAIGSAGSGRYLGRLLGQASEGGFEGAALGRALRALVEAARLRQALPEADPKLLEPFFAHADGAVRSDAVRLAGFWKKDSHVAVLLKAVASAPASERALMFESLRQIGNEAVKTGLARLSGEGSEPVVRRGAAVALAALDAGRGFAAVTVAARTLSGDAESLEYWRAVLGIKGAAVPLRGALEFQNLPEAAARAGIRVAREGGRNDVELVGAFAKAGGLAADAEKLTGDLIKELAARAVAEGDPVRGERVFRRADLACMTCHGIGGAGGLVGPDMTSIGASAPADYLVEALLLPNAKIKEGYHAVVVETKDGEEVTGTVARETQQELFLRNATGQEVAIAKTTIARRENGKLSLMPSGLLEPVVEKDRLDLFAFLSRLGKPGPFDASKGGVARRWRLAHVVHTDQQNNDGDWFLKRPLSDKRWVPLYTLVSGGIPRDLLDDAIKAQAWSSKLALVAATEIDQAVAGSVTFKSSVPDAELWVGGRMIGKGGEVRAELPAGRHRVVLKLDPRQAPEMLRLEAVGTSFVLN